MALAQADIEQIQTLINQSIQATPAVSNANVRYELELRERITRVEEELKHQRELMLTGFAQSEKRFEHTEKRFEQIDKQLEQMRYDSEKRFEQVDKQLEQMRYDSEKRFEKIDKQFEKIDKQFEKIDKQFEKIDKQFERVDKQFELQYKAIIEIHQEIKLQMRWSFGVLIAVGGVVIGVLRLMA